MSKLNDFDLDVKVKADITKVGPAVTSKSVCTPGCITGVLMCEHKILVYLVTLVLSANDNLVPKRAVKN